MTERPPLTRRQAEVAGLIARGLPTKIVARELDISPETAKTYVKQAAARLPGPGSPRHRLTLWVINQEPDDE